jgi:hypothetical protein
MIELMCIYELYTTKTKDIQRSIGFGLQTRSFFAKTFFEYHVDQRIELDLLCTIYEATMDKFAKVVKLQTREVKQEAVTGQMTTTKAF